MSRTTVRLSTALTSAILATSIIVLPTSGVSEAAYNVGVKSLHFEAASDSCNLGQLVPCTAGAGTGDANVLLVTQSVVDGYHQFNGLEGTSNSDGHLWLAADMGAECKLAHHLSGGFIDSDLGITKLDGMVPVDAGGVGNGNGPGWPLQVPVGNQRTMPTRRIAIDMPIDQAFAWPTIHGFSTEDWVYHVGESMIDQRMAEGMTAAEARGLPYEVETTITVAAEVHCKYNGVIVAEYFKRRYEEIPLTIRYEPAEVAPAVGEHPQPTKDVTSAPKVTDLFLTIVADPADPCVLHLSGMIHTNKATTVEYLWRNQFGQPSNTFSIDIDATQSGLVHDTVAIPYLEGPDFTDDLVAIEGHTDLDQFAAVLDDNRHQGTYELEIVTPNHVKAVKAFDVEYCPVPPQRTPIVESGPGGLTGGNRPTHTKSTTLVVGS